MVRMKMDDRHRYAYLFKPKNYNDISILLWGNIITDWQWAMQTLIWKQYYEKSKIL